MSTMLQVLKGSLEFQLENDILYEKVCLDHGVTTSDTYTGTDAQQEDVDMCKADLYLELAAAPDLRDGGSSVTWSSKRLLAARKALYAKWGGTPPEVSNLDVIDGERIW